MQDLLEEETFQSPPAAARITQQQLAWTIAVVSVLLVANMISLAVADSIAPVRRGAHYDRLREIVRFSALGLMMAQLPMAWIWLRVHVASRSVRLVGGWVASHVIVASFFTASRLSLGIRWDWEPFIGIGLTLYFCFLGTGWFTNLFVYRCGLSHLWGRGQRQSQFAIGDLLSFTFVAAMLTGELMVIRESIPWLFSMFFVIAVLVSTFFVVCGALLATLVLGCFYSPKSAFFIISLLLLIMFGPTLLIGLQALVFGIRDNDSFITSNSAVWSFAATIMLIIPTLPGAAREQERVEQERVEQTVVH